MIGDHYMLQYNGLFTGDAVTFQSKGIGDTTIHNTFYLNALPTGYAVTFQPGTRLERIMLVESPIRRPPGRKRDHVESTYLSDYFLCHLTYW